MTDRGQIIPFPVSVDPEPSIVRCECGNDQYFHMIDYGENVFINCLKCGEIIGAAEQFQEDTEYEE